MNILILNWRDPKNPRAGGAELVTMEHAKAWVTAGHSVAWFTSNFNGGKTEELIDGVHIYRRGSSVTTLLLAPFFYFKNRSQYQLIIDEIHGLPFMTPLYVRKTKLAFIHEVAVEIWDYMYPYPLNILGKWFESWYFKFYKNVTFWTVSDSTKKELQNRGVKNVTVIHNGIDIKAVDGEKEQKPTFVFVSRLVKMKGIEDIIDAFALIYEKDTTSQLWLIGTGEDEYVSRLKRHVITRNLDKNVTFFGHVPENKKNQLLRRAHILLHASVKEGWGLVVLEAAAQSTPAVVYNVAGLRDSVVNDKTGLVISKNTPEELARQAVELLRDKKRYKEMQVRAYNWAKSFTWEKSTQQSLRLITSL